MIAKDIDICYELKLKLVVVWLHKGATFLLTSSDRLLHGRGGGGGGGGDMVPNYETLDFI